MLMKNAITMGIIISLPTANIATISTIPNNSKDRFTVNGSWFMKRI
jgi:hypothetical protein